MYAPWPLATSDEGRNWVKIREPKGSVKFKISERINRVSTDPRLAVRRSLSGNRACSSHVERNFSPILLVYLSRYRLPCGWVKTSCCRKTLRSPTARLTSLEAFWDWGIANCSKVASEVRFESDEVLVLFFLLFTLVSFTFSRLHKFPNEILKIRMYSYDKKCKLTKFEEIVINDSRIVHIEKIDNTLNRKQIFQEFPHCRVLHVPHDHILLDRSPNIRPLISRWEFDKFKNCWNKS